MNERDTEIAKQAGLEFTYDPTETPMSVFVEARGEDLETFADLIRADEREKCSKTRAGKPRILPSVGTGALWSEQAYCFTKGWHEGAASVRKAIRARGNT
jgi:hypothetical protein